jgi:hypothetical protein
LEVLNTHYNHMAINLRCLEFDLRWGMEGTDRIPTEWADIAAEPYCPYKEKVTLRLDEDAGVVQGAERDKPLPTMAEELAVEAETMWTCGRGGMHGRHRGWRQRIWT